MAPTLPQFLILCPLTLMAGYIDAVAGGGGLITLPTYLLIGLPPHNALATNKLSASFGAVFATVRYGRQGYINKRLALICVPAALLGAFCGAKLSLLVPEDTFRLMLALILPVVAWNVLRKKTALGGGKTPDELPWPKTGIISALISLALGIYDGFYGPGTGTFLMLLLSSVVGLELRSCVGATKIINTSSNICAFVTFLFSGQVIFSLGMAGAICSAIGNWLGAGSFSRRGVKLLRPLIILVLSLLFLKTIWELFF